MATLLVTTILVLLFSVTEIQAFWSWFESYPYSLDNGLGALTGLKGWNRPVWNYKLQLNQPCSFCSHTNAPSCCVFTGNCCNDFPVCRPNLQCRLTQKCDISSDILDYCSLLGCCRINATHCCPQLAATLPFEPLLLVTDKSASPQPLKNPFLPQRVTYINPYTTPTFKN